jgi:hypothetical protein
LDLRFEFFPKSTEQTAIGTGVTTMKTITATKLVWTISRPFSGLGTGTLLCSLMLWGSGSEASATNIYTLEVPVTVPWTDTGINLPAGSQLDITASGAVQYGPTIYQFGDANGGDNTGAQFLSDMMLPSTVCVSLVGKIGGTTAIGDGTPVPEGMPGNGPGFVGTSYSEVISTSGELFLGFNDNPTAFWDNSGSFSVTVSVVPVPEPSTAAFAGIAGCLALWLRGNRRRTLAGGPKQM